MKTLEDLQIQRNGAEYKARDWRAEANEVFIFAQYAKDDIDGGDCRQLKLPSRWSGRSSWKQRKKPESKWTEAFFMAPAAGLEPAT